MQSLEFRGLRVEIFAPHAPSFAPAPNTLPVASFATPMTQSVQPATSTPLLSSAPIIYLHVLDFGTTGTGEIYELVSRRSGADFVLAAIYLNEAQWGDKLSPWAAKSPFKGVRDFAGGGAAHLEK